MTTLLRNKTRQIHWPSQAQIWRKIHIVILLALGGFIAAAGYVIFQVPHHIVAGGLSGVSIIINAFTGWPVGLLFWVMNVPLLILGFFQLGRWSFLWRTLFAATVFSASADLLLAVLPQTLPQWPLTDDMLLNTIYGGIIGGVGLGMVYRAGGTTGGTSILGRVWQRKTGRPLSQVYFYSDGLIILTGALVFGWEIALYGFITLFIGGLAADYTLEGPSRTRTATIVTNQPEAVMQIIMEKLGRGVSYWPITGGYTGRQHYLLYCTVTRPQVQELKQVIAQTDPAAFVTIGVGHQALGDGFSPIVKETL